MRLPFRLTLAILRSRMLRLPAPMLPRPQLVIGGQIQEHRFEVRVDRGEFRNVQTAISQHSSNDGRVEPAVGKAYLQKPIG